MARLTIEKISHINPFELIVIASQRAKDLNAGASAVVKKNGDKNTVIALREIENRYIDPNRIKEKIIENNIKAIEERKKLIK